VSILTEDILVAVIFSLLLVSAEAFLLYCLSRWAGDGKQQSRASFNEAPWIGSAISEIVPVQFLGPATIVVWSEGCLSP
jgi:hypothetical protein